MSATGAAAVSPRWVRLAALVILLASVAVRLPFMGYYHLEGIDRDTAGYMKVAENIAGGSGWVNHSVRYLFALPDSIPSPDSYWSPLFPLMLAGVFRVTGSSFEAAQWLTFFFGAWVPVLVFLLALGLTRSRTAAVIAGALAVFHPTFITSSCRVMPEIIMICFVALALALLFYPGRRWGKEVALGVVAGLAYLLKYQNGALAAPIVVYYLFALPWRRAVARIAVVGVAAVAVASPWLIRNAVVFGDPFYSVVRSGIVSYYPEFAGEARFVATLQEPPSGWPYILSHLRDAKGLIHNSLYTMVAPFFRDYAGSFALTPFVALGLLTMGSAWRRWAPLVAFAAFIVAFFSITMPLVRYVLVLLPVWVVFAAAGLHRVLRWTERAPRARAMGRVVVAGIVVFAMTTQTRHAISIATDTESEWTPGANFGMLEAGAVEEFVDAHTAPGDVVLCAETYHYALVLDRPCLQVPFDEELLVYLRDRYHVRYMVTSLRELRRRLPAWETHAPGWAVLVHRVAADDVPRPPWNREYRHTSEMRIYELR